MEKQRIKRTCKFGKRLLILSLLFCSIFVTETLWAQNTTTTERLMPVENQKLYPKQDIKYEIYIPRVKPTNVQLQTQSLTSGIELKTLRKTEFFTDEGGTLLELWYRFEKKGKYNIPRLSLLVNGKRRYFYFEPITIEEDPANMLPRMVIQFENGKTVYSDDFFTTTPLFNQEVGKKLKFRVNLQYSTQLVQFNWEIPQDSIYTQTKTYEITEIRYREKNYTNELIPVADFEWTGLAKGTVPIPKIKLVATAYKGYRSELTFPAFLINFTEATTPFENESLNEKLFEAAFDTSISSNIKTEQIQVSQEDCEKIAELRIAERKNPFTFLSIRKERTELEESLGLPSGNVEFNLGILYISAIIVAFFIFIFIIFIVKKKIIAVVISTVLLICSIAVCSYSAAIASRTYAISKLCHLHSIPETNANSSSEITPGSRVLITEKAGNWYYVELGTISGWCKKDELILIR